MTDITLFTNAASRGIVVHWMLEELGVPYEIKDIPFGPRMKVPSYTDINPMGKVPALQHGEAVVTETAAIVTYLADAFPEKNLIPPHGSAARAAFYRWLFFASGPLEQACSAAILGWELEGTTPWGTPAKGYVGFGSLTLTLDALEQQLTNNTYICGEQFTAADVYLGSHFNFSINMAKVVEARPVFTAYINRLLERPARQRVDATYAA